MKEIVSNLFLGFSIVCCVAFLVFLWWAINGWLQERKKKDRRVNDNDGKP